VLAENKSFLSPLTAGQRISNWTLAHVYRWKRPSFERLNTKDFDVLELGLKGQAINRLGVGMRLAAQTIPAIKRIIMAAKPHKEGWIGDEWSAGSVKIDSVAFQAPTIRRLYDLDGPEVYDPDQPEQGPKWFSYLEVEIRESFPNTWSWVLIDHGLEIAASVQPYTTPGECEADVVRIFASIPLKITVKSHLQEEDTDNQITLS